MASALFVAYILGAIAWGICWIVISRFLEKLPTLSSWLGRWRLLRWIAGVMNLNLDRPWEANFARQALCFTAVGFLILAAGYLRGAHKRSVEWYAIEPPSDISGSLAGDPRPDLSPWIGDWTVRGVFWTKDACLHWLAREAEVEANSPHDWYDAFVAAQRCIAANTPHAPEPDSDWEPSDAPG